MLSILIVNWNTKTFLDACLTSLRHHPGAHAVEVIVVDNASTDGSADLVRTQFPEVKLIASETNTGYARGNNLAYQAATGDLILTLNPDTEVYEDTLDIAIAKMAEHPEIGALGARQIHSSGETQSSVRGFPTAWGIVGDITGLAQAFPWGKLGSYRLSAFDYEKELLAPQPMGTFLLFRREALNQVLTPNGPYDEEFPIFFNEVDLLYRLKQKGWNALYSPEVRILHHGGEGTKQVRKNMIWESHRSLVRYFEKHHRSPWLPLFRGIVLAGAFVRARGVYAGFRP